MTSAATAPVWDSATLLTIDMQVDFAEAGAAPVAGTAAVAPLVGDLVSAFRRARRPVVHVVRLYDPNTGAVALVRREAIPAGAGIVAAGSAGSALLPRVAASGALPIDARELLAGRPVPLGPCEVVLFKPRWGAFYRTGLESWLRNRGVTTVVVAGCNLPNCPRATLVEASERDFRTVLAVDAVSQVSQERLGDLERIGVHLLTAGAVIRSLDRGCAGRSGHRGETSHG